VKRQCDWRPQVGGGGFFDSLNELLNRPKRVANQLPTYN
jgi:hypothetical protein